MNMTTWRLFGSEFMSLKGAMDRLFEESLVPFFRRTIGETVRPLPYDLYETADGFYLRCWVPGVKPEDLDITIDKGLLTIRGSYPPAYEDQERVVGHAHYLPEGRFGCTISLPQGVDVDHAQATFENGMLTLYLPKVEAARPKQIPIRTPAS